MRAAWSFVLLTGMVLAQAKDEKAGILSNKLDTAAAEIARQFDGVMGFAILDLEASGG